MPDRRLNRRQFLGAVTAGVGLAACDSTKPDTQNLEDTTIHARPHLPSNGITPGWQSLGIGGTRDGMIYAPVNYNRDVPAPLAVLLHGAGGSASTWVNGSAGELADAHGIILLCPDSRGTTWDKIEDGLYGPDIEFIDAALDMTFDLCKVDSSRICLGGFSDGAGYALSVGVGNGDLFTHLMVFSPGFFLPLGRRGKPRVFVTHGTADPVLPYGYTAGTIVPGLQRDGYQVEWLPFPGGHAVSNYVGEQAFAWFAGP